ncbi:MAG: peptidylprolyl isomerase [bacterium]
MKKMILLAIPLLILSCQETQDVIVKVDGSALTKEQFEKYIPETEYKKLTAGKLEEFCRNWADQEVLYLEAKKQGLDQEDSIKLVLDEYKKNLLAMDLIRREFGATTVSEIEVRDYFDKHNTEFLYAVKLAQIVLPSREAAQQTLDEIKAGANFLKLARERSLTRMENPDDPKVVTDFLYRGTVSDYGTEEIIFNLKVGEVSEVIPYIQGTFLIVELVDKRKVYAKADYDKYSSSIFNYLMQKKYQDFLNSYIDGLKNQYKIEIDVTPLTE